MDSQVENDPGFARLLGLEPPYAVSRCLRCSLRWLNPRPTRDGYAEIYKYDSYFEGEAAVEQYDDLLLERKRYFAARLDRIQGLFARDNLTRILDVGAATGEFVHEAQLRNMEAIGIELSEGARASALHRYSIELLSCDMSSLSENSFNVIHMNHVLEHLPSPLAALTTCYRLLCAGGYVVLEVPQQLINDLDLARRALGLSKPNFSIYSLHHTYFYSKSNFRLLLEKAGFTIHSISTANPARTPLWPPSLKNMALRVYLGLADQIHDAGNIIEVYAVKP